MANSDWYLDAMIRATKLPWGAGQHVEALKMIDEEIAKSDQNKEATAVRWLRFKLA